MKPDGVTKDGHSWWNISKMPVKFILNQQKSMEHQLSWKHQTEEVKFIAGAKVFEKPGKLTVMAAINNMSKKKYDYQWAATFHFKKKGIVLFVNQKIGKKLMPGKAFANSTFRLNNWKDLIHALNPGWMGESADYKKMTGRTKRIAACEKRLAELIYSKAKKEGLSYYKIKKKDISKIDFDLFRLMAGSEILCNTVYYAMKGPQKDCYVSLSKAECGLKEYREALKVIKKYNSMEKICKKTFGRNSKSIMKLVQNQFAQSWSVRKVKISKAKFTVNGVDIKIIPPETVTPWQEGSTATITGANIPENEKTKSVEIGLSVFMFGMWAKQFVNFDKMQDTFQTIIEQGGKGTYAYKMIQNGQLFAPGRYQIVTAFLMSFNEHRRTSIIKELLTGSNWSDSRSQQNLFDAALIWHPIRANMVIPGDLKTLQQIHDYISRESNKLNTGNFDLMFDDEVKKLDGVVLGNLQLVIPKTNHELVDWGQWMSNCIGGYGKRINSSDNKQWLMAVLKDGKLTYNIEVHNKRLNQFYGHHNSRANEEDKKIVVDYLISKELVNLNSKSQVDEMLGPLVAALDAGGYGAPLQNEPLQELQFMGMDHQIRQAELNHQADALRYALAANLAMPVPAPPAVIQNVALEPIQALEDDEF